MIEITDKGKKNYGWGKGKAAGVTDPNPILGIEPTTKTLSGLSIRIKKKKSK